MSSGMAIADSGLAGKVSQGVKIIQFVGASGSGKTTVIRRLLANDNRFGLMTSYTTRKSRPSDLPGEYSYVAQDQFQRLEKQGEFLHVVGPHGNQYATRKTDIDAALAAEFPTLMHVVPECVPHFERYAPKRVVPIFMYIRSVGILEDRLRRRDPDKPDEYYRERVESCLDWHKQAEGSGLYRKFVDNSGHEDTTFTNVTRFLETLAMGS